MKAAEKKQRIGTKRRRLVFTWRLATSLLMLTRQRYAQIPCRMTFTESLAISLSTIRWRLSGLMTAEQKASIGKYVLEEVLHCATCIVTFQYMQGRGVALLIIASAVPIGSASSLQYPDSAFSMRLRNEESSLRTANRSIPVIRSVRSGKVQICKDASWLS